MLHEPVRSWRQSDPTRQVVAINSSGAFSGAVVLTERRALFLSLEAGEAAGDVAWEAQFLTTEEAAALPTGLIGREESHD